MYYLGIDVGGMSVKAGIVDETGKLVKKHAIVTDAIGKTQQFITDIIRLCDEVLALANLKREDIVSVGIGMPGTVNPIDGIVTYACNIGFKNVPLREIFQKEWDVPLYLANDADSASLAEVKFGGGVGTSDALMVTLGTGVGTGIVIGGKIFSGRGGSGGESGHIVLVVDGEQCACGRRGCFEAYASATALMRMTKKAADDSPNSQLALLAKDGVDGRTAFKARLMGDKVGEEVVSTYVKYVGEGITNLVNIFRPEIVLVGGGVSHEGDYFIKMLEDYVNDNAYGKGINPYVPVKKALLGNDAGIIGAAALGM